MTRNRLILGRNQHLEGGRKLNELLVFVAAFGLRAGLNPQHAGQLYLQSFWPEESIDRMQDNQSHWKVRRGILERTKSERRSPTYTPSSHIWLTYEPYRETQKILS